MVQNATLAKFAKLYKMDQALMMGAGAENMRTDQKSECITESSKATLTYDSTSSTCRYIRSIRGRCPSSTWFGDNDALGGRSYSSL